MGAVEFSPLFRENLCTPVFVLTSHGAIRYVREIYLQRNDAAYGVPSS